MAQGGHGALLLLLIQDLKLVLGQGLARLRHHLNHIHDQDLPKRWVAESGCWTLPASKAPLATYPPSARDLLPLHEAGPGGHVALEARYGLLAAQRHSLHAGHVLPLLQLDSAGGALVRASPGPPHPGPPHPGTASPGIGDGLPADGGDELDAEGLLLRVDVPLVCEDRRGPSGRSGPQDRPRAEPRAPLSMVSNSFSSPVMRGTRVQGVLVLVATAYTLGRAGCQEPEPTSAPRVTSQVGTDLGLHMVSHIVGGAAQRDLPNRPRGVVGQVGGQNADPQLTLGGHRGERGLAPTEGRADEPRPRGLPQVSPRLRWNRGSNRGCGPLSCSSGASCPFTQVCPGLAMGVA